MYKAIFLYQVRYAWLVINRKIKLHAACRAWSYHYGEIMKSVNSSSLPCITSDYLVTWPITPHRHENTSELKQEITLGGGWGGGGIRGEGLPISTPTPAPYTDFWDLNGSRRFGILIKSIRKPRNSRAWQQLGFIAGNLVFTKELSKKATLPIPTDFFYVSCYKAHS